jgi:hypothetical protein
MWQVKQDNRSGNRAGAICTHRAPEASEHRTEPLLALEQLHLQLQQETLVPNGLTLWQKRMENSLFKIGGLFKMVIIFKQQKLIFS